MTRPRLLDLFCGAGGAAMGYYRAGFDVVGVDIEPQPRYPFEFVQHDAIELLDDVADYGVDVLHDSFGHIDAIHASPPCQIFAAMSNRWKGAGGLRDERIDLLTPVRSLLRHLDIPYVIENITGARGAMAATLTLHGGMFGLGVHRPRLFESNVLILGPQAPQVVNPIGVYGKQHDGRRLFTRANGEIQRAAASLKEAQEAMGMDWGDWPGVKEAIPPTYTEYLGQQLLEHIAAVAA